MKDFMQIRENSIVQLIIIWGRDYLDQKNWYLESKIDLVSYYVAWGLSGIFPVCCVYVGTCWAVAGDVPKLPLSCLGGTRGQQDPLDVISSAEDLMWLQCSHNLAEGKVVVFFSLLNNISCHMWAIYFFLSVANVKVRL